ncbi:hypothetical protein BH09ACT10_BH09ACT10_11980 [soil metagenome]
MTARDVTADEHLAIMKAFTNYSRGIDDSNYDQLDDAFAPDGIWVMADGTELKGLEQIKGLLKDSADFLPYRFLHAVSNVDMQIDDGVVHSTSNWTYHIRSTPEDGPTRQMAVTGAWELGSVGTYEDILEFIDGKWLFTFRKIYNWEFSEPNPRS